MSKQRKVDKKMTTTNTNEDKLILGGHEFTPFIWIWKIFIGAYESMY